MKKDLSLPLQMLGLDPDTAKTYLACLQVGKSRANDIAKAARIHRTVIYRHLDALVERGLVHMALEANTRIYTPANPSIVGEIVKEKLSETESLIPSLLALYATASPGKPTFRYYTDVAGVKMILEEILQCHNKFYRHIGGFNQKEFHRLFGERYLVDWSERRINRGVDHQSIRPLAWKTNETHQPPIFTGIGKAFLRDYRFAPIPSDLPILIYLYDEKVAFISARIGHTYAAVLESADVYQTLNSLFEIIWQTAEPPENAPTER